MAPSNESAPALTNPIQDTLASIRGTTTRLNDEITSIQERISRLETSMRRQPDHVFRTCAANALYDLTKRVLKASDPDYNPFEDKLNARIVETARNITEQQLKDLNIPIKYLRLLHKLPSIIGKCNSLDTSGMFAIHLMENYRNTNIFLLWEDIFFVLYGEDVEQMANRGDWLDDLLGDSPPI